MSIGTLVTFLIGLLIGALAIHKWDERQYSGIRIEGVVKHEKRKAVDSASPPPPGYYVMTRVYLQYDVPEWVGKEVRFAGHIHRVGDNLSGRYPLVTSIATPVLVNGVVDMGVHATVDIQQMRHCAVGAINCEVAGKK